MAAEKPLSARPRKKTSTRIFKFIAALLLILIVSAFFLVPAFISSRTAQEIILTRINDSIDGQVDFSNLSMGWLRGIRLTDISFNDSTERTSVEVKQIITRPRYLALLTGSLSFGEIVIDEPKAEIDLRHKAAKSAQNPPQQQSADKKPQKTAALPIKEANIVINNGQLKITDPQSETAEILQINCNLTIKSADGPLTDKLPANLKVKADFQFAQAGYTGLNLGPAKINIELENSLLRIAPFSTSVNNGQFNFSAETDFARQPVLLKTTGPLELAKDIEINDQLGRKLLVYINPIFAETFNLTGRANFNCRSLVIPLGKADKNDLEVIGTISMEQVKLRPTGLLGTILSAIGQASKAQTITIHPTEFSLQNGYLSYEDMQIDIGNNPVNFRGTIGLDKSLDMKVTLPYTYSGRTARVGEESTEKRITVKLTGTADKPELDVKELLGRGLLEDKLKEQLGEEIGEKAVELLEELLK